MTAPGSVMGAGSSHSAQSSSALKVSVPKSEPRAWRRAALKSAVEQAALLLPEQAPLQAFVHHNTLHAFEHLPFERALEQAGSLLGAEAYPTEDALARYVEAGSIEEPDVAAVVEEEFALALQRAELGGLALRDFLVRRLMNPLELPSAAAVNYQLSEGQLTSHLHASVPPERRLELEAFAASRYGVHGRLAIPRLLGDLWDVMLLASPAQAPEVVRAVRRRDQLLQLGCEDADSLAMPHLIRLAGAYLDQGISSWPMPERQRGFYHCFRELYRSPWGVLEKWLAPLSAELRRQHAAGFVAEDACVWALEQLSIPIEGYRSYVEAVLLSMRGWAGMFRMVENHPERCPALPIPARLVDFLAVALILETYAAAFVRRSAMEPSAARERSTGHDLELAYEGFVLAQSNPIQLEGLLDRKLAGAWLEWIKRLSGVARRRLLWRALERHHLQALTSGLSEHVRFLAQRRVPAAKFQAIFCIDDREESYRRHLEEVEPGAVTFSYPGFFGVAMRFHGYGQLRPRDLCPLVVSATHVVREVDASGARARPAGFPAGVVPHRHLASTTLFRGSLLALLGGLSIIPLVMRVLFPRWFHTQAKSGAPPTEFLLVRRQEPAPGELPEGYSDEEMADVVQRMLGDIGLTAGFCPLVLVVGHGASSVNNPLLAAYGCGATAGGCGGPNARVVCTMANRPEVRRLLRERGMDIPDGTVFVAGMHDTTTDDVSLYPSLDLAGPAREVLASAERALAEASMRNAHERCRLFHQVPTDIGATAAKALVESRSADLAAARPEFNHAKNSCAIVGRRRYTRGLFLDKRAFLVSTDSTNDPDGEALERMIMGSVPVGMGINLEYFFATVDNGKYGSGSKLPHNVSGLMGIMNGHASDLQTGLNSQMVEPHEPIRLVTVIEASPELLVRILARRPALKRLVENGWMHLVAWEPEDDCCYFFDSGQFRRLAPAAAGLASVERSLDAYRGRRGPLPLAHVTAGLEVLS